MSSDLATPPPVRSAEAETPASPAGCVVRLAWLLGGPAGLIFSAAMLADPRRDHVALAVAGLWGTVAAMLALRHVDIAYLGGLRANAEPATRADFGRYAVGVVLVGLLLSAGAFWWRS